MNLILRSVELTKKEFNYCQIDPYTATEEQLKKEISRLDNLHDEYYNLEQALKIFLNSTYGALASPFFYGFETSLAESITLQGQDLVKYAAKCIDNYFLNRWHKDKDLHKELGLNYVNQIKTDSLQIYTDTDSSCRHTVVSIKRDETKERKTIEQWYNENIKNGSAGVTLNGHESVKTNDKILNWNDNLYWANVKRIIRHRVNKSKWKLKTKSGKEIIVTNDHSMIVFRDGQKLKVKPSEILKSDKILVVM